MSPTTVKFQAVVEERPPDPSLPNGWYNATWHWYTITVLYNRYEYRFIAPFGAMNYKAEPFFCLLHATNGEYEVQPIS